MKEHDELAGTVRIPPGHMLEDFRGEPVVLPMLPPEATKQLAMGGSLSDFYAHRELDQQVALHEANPEATPEDLWSLTAKPVAGRLPSREEPPTENAIKRTDRLSALPMPSMESLGITVTQRKITDLKDIPKEVVHILQHEFAEGFALRESMVEAVCGVLGGIHQWMHPVARDLEPGQAVWMARSIASPRD